MKIKDHRKIARVVISDEIEGLKKLYRSLDNNFNKAVDKIFRTSGKICFIGLGKSGIVAERASKTLASVGTPSIYINASEFSHGDSGILQQQDLMCIFSSSGETRELKNCITFANRWGLTLIGVCQKKNSILYNLADIKILLPPARETGLSIIPTTSLAMFSSFSNALGIALMKQKGFGLKDLKKLHPGGSIGAALLSVADLYVSDKKKLPLVNENRSMHDGLKIMSAKKIWNFNCFKL